MKSGIIVAGVVGVCALFGAGVSAVVTPMVENVNVPAIEFSSETEPDQVNYQALKADLEAKYKDFVFTDTALQDLACGEDEDFFSGPNCYDGPSEQIEYFGTATVTDRSGETTSVQLVSMQAGAFLLK